MLSTAPPPGTSTRARCGVWMTRSFLVNPAYAISSSLAAKLCCAVPYICDFYLLIRICRSIRPLDDDLPALAGLHDMEAAFPIGKRAPMSDHGRYIQSRLQHHG